MPKLFMILVGCRPKGRHTEQHDVYFGVAENVKELIPEIIQFWPEAKGNLHIDGWRTVENVNGQSISVVRREEKRPTNNQQLFFINLGGYKPNEFEEFNYKMLVTGSTKSEAIKQSKQTAFFKHTGFPGAVSHIDDKYGVDVDDIFDIHDILSDGTRTQYKIVIQQATDNFPHDEIHLGYFRLESFE